MVKLYVRMAAVDDAGQKCGGDCVGLRLAVGYGLYGVNVSTIIAVKNKKKR